VPARVLVLGLDGASWNVIDALGARLPNLRRLVAEGASAPLRSTTPAMTLPAWSSVLTGCHPGTHGIPDFTVRAPGRYGLRFVDATARRVPTIHRVLAERGARVASIAVPTTWPPERLPNDGVVVSGFDSPVATRAEARHYAPASLHAEVEARFGGLRFADFQEGDPGAPGWHDHARESLLREVARKEALCAWLLDGATWDLFMVVFGESDTASHHFWAFHDPGSPRHLAGSGHADTLAEVYARLDAAVGALARRGEHVCIVSDHGFGPAGTQALYLNRWLATQGWLTFGGGGATAGWRARALDAARLAAMRLPVERIVRRVPPSWLGRVEAAARWQGIDFPRTRAWSDELNYAATIHLNLAGRDPCGTVSDEAGAVAGLRAALRDWREDGQPVVAAAWTRREAYGGRGDAVPGAPDLVLDLALQDGASATLLPSARAPAGTTARRFTAAEYVGGKGLGMNGAHRPHGVLILHGPGVRDGVVLPADDGPPPGARAGTEDPARGPEMCDVAPTLLHLLGQEIPAHMEGRVLAGAVRDAPAPRRAPSAPPAPPPREGAMSPDDADGIRARLAALGYLS
jgi:predicted AlkP superfamily phosphohydrolase/phosphomutase